MSTQPNNLTRVEDNHAAESDPPAESPEVKPVIDKITWDAEHSDPAAEIVLVASDNVYFRISRWYFSRSR
jgi:hypothetical protein